MSIVELRVEIPPAAVDASEEILLEMGDLHWSILEDVAGGRCWLQGIFPEESEARESWLRLRSVLPVPPTASPEIQTRPEEEWRNSYRAHFRSTSYGPLHWVPDWERDRFQSPPGSRVVWLDPGLAFGTGNHESTRLCAERLVERAAQLEDRGVMLGGLQVLDAGCGSGILALSAVRLGFGRVRGFDTDPEAIRVSRENAVRNDLEGVIEWRVSGLETTLVEGGADLILANLQADLLTRSVLPLLAAVAPGGMLVMSGILTREISELRAAFQARAPRWNADTRQLGEWSDLVLVRPES